jgi:L-rhamnose mutarotase
MRRFGQVIKLKPEKAGYYLKLHAEPWSCVLDKIKEFNIRNYSIFLHDQFLIAYFEYTGEDFEADMKKMADDECTQRWWKETVPCQESLSMDGSSWWVNMEEIFHT